MSSSPSTENSGRRRKNSKAICNETAKLLKELTFHRRGLGFYTLRHTTETIGGESMDQAAVDRIMGHVPNAKDMSAVYRERMTDKTVIPGGQSRSQVALQ